MGHIELFVSNKSMYIGWLAATAVSACIVIVSLIMHMEVFSIMGAIAYVICSFVSGNLGKVYRRIEKWLDEIPGPETVLGVLIAFVIVAPIAFALHCLVGWMFLSAELSQGKNKRKYVLDKYGLEELQDYYEFAEKQREIIRNLEREQSVLKKNIGISK